MSALNVEVRDVRLSFVWTRCHLDILLDPQAASRLKFLGRRFPYEAAFTAAAGGPTNQGLGRPWVVPPGQPFWSHYLEGARLDRVTPSQAWRALVPFRRRLEVVADAPGSEMRLVPHGFFYPHGVGLVLDVTSKKHETLAAGVDRAVTLVKDTELRVSFAGSKPETMHLSDLANKIMDDLSNELLDGQYAAASNIGDPFSVFTVVAGAGAPPLPGPAQDPELHKALEGLVTWNAYWRDTAPAALKERSLPIEAGPASHVLYGAARGRAVWLPFAFTATQRPQTALSTRHRDLVLTSLQVESLAGFFAATADYLDTQGGTLQAAHADCARPIAGLLGRLYGQTGFPSWSPRWQIDQNHYVEVINRLRTHFQQPALH